MRRIVAIVLPQLACEIARRKTGVKGPLGVIIGQGSATEPTPATAVLDRVSEDARRYGVRAGQRVTEAHGLLARLAVHHVELDEIDDALGRVAEIALAFGPTAATRLRTDAASSVRAASDTVWLDLTGAAHLFGGEEAVIDELAERIFALGHRARIAIASGPRIAEAFARWSGKTEITRTSHGERAAIVKLPVNALPLDPETSSFLFRLGVITVGDLLRLPRAKVAARLGPNTAEVLALAEGRDDAPLVPYAPTREIVETMSFDEGVETTDGLLFVLRGIVSRASARLLARGEATTQLAVAIPLDRSIARLRDVGNETLTDFQIELPAPLSTEKDLLRALAARLERMVLPAPAIGLQLRVAQIVPSPRVQLDLSRGRAVSPDSLPALLAELSAEIGAEHLGLLSVEDAYQPEASSRVVPVTIDQRDGRASRRVRRASPQLSLPIARSSSSRTAPAIPPPARLLAKPIPLGRTLPGGVVAVPSPNSDHHLFAIEHLTPIMHLEDVEWWTHAPTSRAYMRAWVTSGGGRDTGDLASPVKPARAVASTALVYVEKRSGEMFLHGWYE